VHFLKTSFYISLILFFSGCAVGPNFKSPAAPEITSYTENPISDKTVATNVHGGESQSLIVTEDIPGEWWQLFQSEELNELIERGIENSPTLEAAEATLRQAQSIWWAQLGGTLLPKLSASLLGERQQIPEFSTTTGLNEPVFNFTPGPFNLYNVSTNVSYTLDVFGGLRRNVEAYAAQVDYQQYEMLAAYLSLTSNIVTTAINEASLRGQIKATKEIIAILERQLQIIEKQFKVGGVAKTNVLTQETQLEQTKALLPPLEKSLAQTRDALAVLIGSPPGDANLPKLDLNKLTLPTTLPVSVPSALIKQRPDIAAAEALLHAACAQIGVATANLLPSFTVNGTWGAEASTPRLLFSPGTHIWDIQGQVTQILFNGGALWANRKATIANYDSYFAQYRQTVLVAFQNVADTLNALDQDAKALKINNTAEQIAKNNLVIAQGQYAAGGISYPLLLNAQQQYTQARINLITAQAARYADTAALFQAMGGGWWNLEDENEI
jgi:NodT family efflux transporter outer membrane factor (OMF) lipoprotein